MMRRRISGGATLALLLLGTIAAHGQYYEDEKEPADLGIVDIDSLIVPPSRYVIEDSCSSCHPAIYREWQGTKHARAYVPLRSRVSREIAHRDSIGIEDPSRSEKCLSCHATASTVPAAYRGPGFRMGEGVVCQNCHGPGERHVKATEPVLLRALTIARIRVQRLARTLLKRPDLSIDLRIPTEEDCMFCHKAKASHEILQPEPFSYLKALERIAHP